MTDAYDSPLPSRGSIPPPSQEQFPGMGSTEVGPERQLGARSAFVGLFIAFAGTIVFATLVAVVFAAAGEHDSDSHGFQFVATFGGDVALVMTAYFVMAHYGRPTPASFGLRPFGSSAIGWVVVAFFSYLILSAIYTVIVQPPSEDLPQQLGADESTLLAIVTGLFVIVAAPFAEEVFFRGFLFQALRNSWGTLGGAAGSAAIFSAIHFELDKFVPLFILGVALALLFQKTRSLWPCIMLHAINNIIAFAVSF